MTPGFRDYDSVPRRRARALLRLGRAVSNPRFYPRARVTPAYWWDGHQNFGDALTPWLLHQRGRMAVHVPPGGAELAGVGSILEQLPPEFSGTVWGSGLLYGVHVDLPHATYAAVRGHLTREVQRIDHPVALGDPGILVARHAPRRATRWTLGVVPHGMHDSDPLFQRFAARHPGEVTIIGTRAPVDSVLRQIASCQAVISSSLHGLVVADSFGIPAARFDLQPSLWGGSFKFRDYESVVSPDRQRRVDFDVDSALGSLLAGVALARSDCVETSASELETSLDQVAATLLPPFAAFRARSH